VPALLGVISIHGCQKDARNIKQGFAPGHRIISCVQEDEAKGRQDSSIAKSEATIMNRPTNGAECETKRVPLDRRVSYKVVMISQNLSPEEGTELLLFLNKNSNVFTWKTSNLMRVSRSIIEHELDVNPSTKPRKQKLHKMSDEKVIVAKAEVQRLLDACFIRELQYESWFTNVVMVKKKDGKWRMSHPSFQILCFKLN
jgi:hypothetical protein